MKLVLTIVFLICCIFAKGQNEFTFVFLNTNEDRPEISEVHQDSLQQGHRANIGQLAKEGKLLVAGPLAGGGGIFVLNTVDVKEAQRWVQTDPAIAANRFRLEILPWTTRIGSACLPSKEADFAKYVFVRYNTHITKFNVQESSRLFADHDIYLKKIGNSHKIISEGVFGNQDGGTMIIDGDVDKNEIMADPAVVNGIIEPVVKEIWLAKGSFCEN